MELSVTARRLRQLRLEKQWTQAEVAKAIGIERTAYVLYESGRNSPSRRIHQLAALFNVSADYILGRSDTRQPEQNADNDETVRAFLRLLCKDNKEAIAIIDRAKITTTGNISLPDTDKITEAVINAQLQNFIQALKNAKPNGDGTATITFRP